MAWGSPLAPALTPDTPFGWNGRFGVRRDAATGLLLAGARWYAPCIGRFTSRDPIGFAGGINLYGYCAGDPVNDADPSGCSPDEDPEVAVLAEVKLQPPSRR